MKLKLAHLKAFLAVFFWGASFPAMKLGLNGFSPLLFSALSLSAAGLVLLLISLCKKEFKLADYPQKSLLNSVLAQTCFQGFLLFGLKSTSASNGALLLACAPLIAFVWKFNRGQQALELRTLLALFLGLAGVCAVVGLRLVPSTGDLLALGAAICWAWYCLAAEHLTQKIGSLKALTLSLLWPGLLFCFLAFLENRSAGLPAAPPEAWLGLAYNTFVALALSMLLWNQALGELGSKTVMFYTYLEPVFAILLSRFILSEALVTSQWFGGAMILCALWLSTSERKKG